MKNTYLKPSARGARRDEYQRSLETICFDFRLSASWREYIEACLFFKRPPPCLMPSGVAVEVESVAQPAIAPGVHPFPVRAVVRDEGVETEAERLGSRRVLDAMNKYLRLRPAVRPRSTYNSERRQRIQHLLEENAKRGPHRKVTLTKLRYEYNERHPEDELTPEQWRSTIKRLLRP